MFWKLKRDANDPAKFREFPLCSYLHVKDIGMPEWMVLKKKRANPKFPFLGVLDLHADIVRGTELKDVGWKLNLAKRLVLTETELPEEQRVLQFLSTSLGGLKCCDSGMHESIERAPDPWNLIGRPITVKE